jgi:hypothetical protein
VLNDPQYRQASRLIAADMATAPGFVGLTEIVDRLVDGTATASRSAQEIR